ncbi:MAG: hypothetical protein PHG27_10735 [Massilibacteroides sp.]|nr:hypothetical protein [Massilibacteroides sp.]MDD4116048.1 hypothetical protein [Massilibacteroides sp.]MDD4661237.1 hypothetical protein [Massilibacteroides sp.]
MKNKINILHSIKKLVTHFPNWKNVQNGLDKILKYSLLVLFIGYYGSITLFTHTHIVNGVVITHSHPYNFFKCKKNEQGERIPLHHHAENGYVLIHILSHFSSLVVFFAIGIKAIEKILTKHTLRKSTTFPRSFHFLCSNGLRAPLILIQS